MSFDIVLFNDSEIKFGFTRSSGPYCIASALKQQGYESLVVNYSSAVTWEKFKKIINLSVGKNTLIVGFSANWFDSQIDLFSNGNRWEEKSVSINFQQKNIKPFVDYIKEVNPKVKVVLGGFTAYKYINESSLDNIFVGYSENQMVEYVNALSKKGPRRIFNKIVNYDVKAAGYNFNSSTIEYSNYDLIHPEETLFFEFARGCIFKCAFCSFPLIGSKTVNYLKHENTIYNELLTNYTKWGITKYFIVDDTFNDSVEKLQVIKNAIEKLPFKPHFASYIRIDLLASHTEMAALIKKIGVVSAFYGLETWNPDTAKIIKKGGSHEKKIKALKIAKNTWGNDITITANLIVGLPNDTTESFEDFIQWYKIEGHRYIDYVLISPFHLSPNDDLNPYKINVSDIDKNKENYGYRFSNNTRLDNNVDFHGGEWEKTEVDTGNILTRKQAEELAVMYNLQIQQIQEDVFGPEYAMSFIKTTSKQVVKLKEKLNIDSFKTEEIIHKVFEIDYYPQLIKMLEDRKNND
jgi:radical SAM superfamily enzyme YgiQ (UPF0313 family)